jgi:uncharacterized protein
MQHEESPLSLKAVRRREREITDRAEIDAILRDGRVMRLALSLNDEPFLVPLYYVYEGGAVYFHSARQGTKVEILGKNDRVCLEVGLGEEVIEAESPCDFEARHRTVIARGRAREVKDQEGRQRAISLIVGKYAKKQLEVPAANLAATLVMRIELESIKGKSHGF